MFCLGFEPGAANMVGGDESSEVCMIVFISILFLNVRK